MTTNLDQGSLLRDVSAGPSGSEVRANDSEEESSPSIRTSEIVQVTK